MMNFLQDWSEAATKKVESFPYSEIAFITAGKGFLDAPLEVVIEGKARRLEADKSQRYAFAEFVAGKLTPRNDKEDTPSKEQRIDRQWFAVMPKGWGGSSDSTIHRGERKMLYDVLDEEGEGIEALVGGTYRAEQDTNRLHRHQGVAVATSKRVLFLDKGILGSKEVSEIPYRSIEAITHSTGMFYGGIQIMGLGRASFRIEDVRPKESAKQFADCVRSLVESLHAEDSHRSTQNVSATSLTEELGKLAVLFRDGSITQSEFDEAKRQLLEHQ